MYCHSLLLLLLFLSCRLNLDLFFDHCTCRDGETDSRSTYTVLAVARILNILTPGKAFMPIISLSPLFPILYLLT